MGTSKNLIILAALFTIGTAFIFDATPDPMCPYPSDKITFFPYPTNCSKYIECYSGTKYIMECPGTLQWNQYTESCDYTCNGTGVSTTPRPTPDNGCPATGNALLPNYGDCTRFYHCRDGVKNEEVCPSGYAYDINVHACEIRSSVDCSYTTRSPVSPTTPRPSNRCPTNGLSYLPDYSDCTKYYQCFMGVETHLSCAEGRAWSIPLSTCDVMQYVDCSYTTLFPPTPNPNNDCPATGRSFLPHAYNCSMFYECIDGAKHLLSCPQGYSFSLTRTSCELNNYVDCGYTSRNPNPGSVTTPATTRTTRGPTAPPGDSCSGQRDGTMLKHPTDCHKYIECEHGKEKVMACPTGTTFDINLGVCDFNDSENCKLYRATDSCFRKRDGTVLKHPTDCHKFIECEHEKEKEMECPTGMTFDINLGVCDFNNSENCKGYNATVY